MVISGRHFSTVLHAAGRILDGSYRTEDVELVCDDELEEYTLQTVEKNPLVIIHAYY